MENPSSASNQPKVGYYIQNNPTPYSQRASKSSVYGDGSEVELDPNQKPTLPIDDEERIEEKFDWNERYQKIFKNLLAVNSKTLK